MAFATHLGNFAVNVVVNVAGSNASPQEIGQRAAVRWAAGCVSR
jgi:hypothetical protein